MGTATAISIVPIDIKRGQMYYARDGKIYMEQRGKDRPCIIVSNDKINEFSDRVMVVYTTRQDKAIDSHVQVNVNGTKSFAITENIQTIYKDRLREYIGDATEEEMANIDREMKKGLALPEEKPKESWKDKPLCLGCPEKENYKEVAKKAEEAAREAKFYKRMYEELLKRVIGR